MSNSNNDFNCEHYCVLYGKRIDGNLMRVSESEADVYLASGLNQELSMITIREFSNENEAKRYVKLLEEVRVSLIKAALTDFFVVFPDSENAYKEFMDSDNEWTIKGYVPLKEFKLISVRGLQNMVKQRLMRYFQVAIEVVEISFVEIDAI